MLSDHSVQTGQNRAFKDKKVSPLLTVQCCFTANTDTGVHAATFWSNCSHCKTEAYKLWLCNLVMKLTDLCTYSCRFKYFISMECKVCRAFLCHICLKCRYGVNKTNSKKKFTYKESLKKEGKLSLMLELVLLYAGILLLLLKM